MDLLQNCRVGRSWHAANFGNLNLTFISYSFWNIRRKVLIFFYKFDEKRARTPRWVIRFTFKLQVKKKNWSQGRTARHIFGREPSNDYFIKILFLLSKWFQTKTFLWEFPIGSYVKLSSAVVAILVGVLKWRTQFWKRTTQGSFQQSLVEIGSVVSEEKIFLKFHPPFFLICIIGQNRQKFKVHKKSRNKC